jgi:hypothetical protein
MTDTASAHVIFKATSKHDNLFVKYRNEWRFNLLNTVEREAFFKAIEDFVLESASAERKAE